MLLTFVLNLNILLNIAGPSEFLLYRSQFGDWRSLKGPALWRKLSEDHLARIQACFWIGTLSNPGPIPQLPLIHLPRLVVMTVAIHYSKSALAFC